jgi:hypothetical protein
VVRGFAATVLAARPARWRRVIAAGTGSDGASTRVMELTICGVRRSAFHPARRERAFRRFRVRRSFSESPPNTLVF